MTLLHQKTQICKHTMTTTANFLPTLPKTAQAAAMFIAPFAAVYKERARLGEFAFASAVRLSDQDKPILLKLLVEMAIVLRALALWARATRATAHQPRRRVAAQGTTRAAKAGHPVVAPAGRERRAHAASRSAVRERRAVGSCRKGRLSADQTLQHAPQLVHIDRLDAVVVETGRQRQAAIMRLAIARQCDEVRPVHARQDA